MYQSQTVGYYHTIYIFGSNYPNTEFFGFRLSTLEEPSITDYRNSDRNTRVVQTDAKLLHARHDAENFLLVHPKKISIIRKVGSTFSILLSPDPKKISLMFHTMKYQKDGKILLLLERLFAERRSIMKI